MTYSRAFNILDPKSLNSFVNQSKTDAGILLNPNIHGSGLILSDEDLWRNWGLNFDWKNPFGLFEKIDTIVRNIVDIWIKVRDTATWIWDFIADQTRSFFKWMWGALGDFLWYASGEFKKLMSDPRGYLWKLIQGAVKPLIDGIKMVGIDIWDFVLKVKNAVSEVVSSWVSSAQNVIVNWITNRIDAVNGWINAIKTSLTNFWDDVVGKIKYYYDRVADIISNIYSGITSVVNNVRDSLAKTFDYGLGGLADAIKKAIENIFTTLWEWTKGILNTVVGLLKESVLLPIWNSMKDAWNWLVGIFRALWEGVKSTLYKLAPSAPEQGEDLINSALTLLGIGVAGFGALTGVSMVVSWLSKHHLGHLSAILYDVSSYKYITGAVMGGLVTAAYAQPLKYFYNAKFRPYLPGWGDTFKAFSRNIIGPDTFKFFLKYGGVSDKHFYIYDSLASDAVAPRLLSTIAEAEILEPEKFFHFVMDNGYDPAKSAYITTALLYRGVSGLIRDCKKALFNNYKEGFISLARLQTELKKMDEKISRPVSFTGADGTRYGATIYLPLPSDTLETIRAEWEYSYDSTKDKVDAATLAFSNEYITEAELRLSLADLGLVPLKIDDMIKRLKAKKKQKIEPEKGKDLRIELKSVLIKAYKDGFLTIDALNEEIDAANIIVDEKLLILKRAGFERFYDDMVDWQKIYVSSLADGLIAEAEFRRDLIDMGFEPSKVELLINYDSAKKAGRAAKKK